MDILDFCYVDYEQGSKPLKDWLKENNLNQKYCGLVKIPNWRDTYGLYYDFASYFKFEVYDKDKEYWEKNFTEENFQNWCFDMRYRTVNSDKFMDYDYCIKTYHRVINREFFGYSGVVHPDEITKSNEVRLSSIPKGEMPICKMSYNKDAYTCHCRDYHNYKDWEKTRNPVRYESNLGHNYDSKNVMHCMRLVRMAKELAKGEGFNVVRSWDRQYLLDIRNHKFEYEDVMEQLEKEKAEMEEAIKNCTLPETVDYGAVNNILIEARKKYVFNNG
jgi:hypothetical protein